jgi:hypothetical protein
MKVVAKPIEMVAWFTLDGVPNPARFRIRDDKEPWTVIKVDRIITRSLEKYAGNEMLVFRCQSVIDGLEKVYELKYEKATCKWILFKI